MSAIEGYRQQALERARAERDHYNQKRERAAFAASSRASFEALSRSGTLVGTNARLTQPFGLWGQSAVDTSCDPHDPLGLGKL